MTYEERKLFSELLEVNKELLKEVRKMATQSDVLAAVTTVSGKIDAAATRVTAAIAAAATPVDEQSVVDAVNALGVKADAIVPPPTTT